ncbi:MAG: class I SAM-dependent methyltransferase [Planctomycetaceae bacterium]|nr:class I SAM-dependent methyltransferase [Planctomycetaceae bacterium]
MAEYRWNQADLAAAYDRDASRVHPRYVDVQDAILNELASGNEPIHGTIVDLGGGSGRLLERVLMRWPEATAVLVDQSQSFLDLATARLAQYPGRATTHCLRLQDDWREVIPVPVAAVISTSAIHHLLPDEKRRCYQKCFDVLRPGGVFLNGDEVRDESEAEYRGHVERWAAHMQQLIDTQAVSPAMADALRGWQRRNVEQAGQPRASGDDCHETAASQLAYLRDAGFVDTAVVWQRELWSVLRGRRAN